jgi:hypothetical protein
VSTIINALARQWPNADTEVVTQLYYLSDRDKGYARIMDEDGCEVRTSRRTDTHG